MGGSFRGRTVSSEETKTGSSPVPSTWPVRLSARTPPFHGGERGSIPLRATNCKVLENVGQRIRLADKPTCLVGDDKEIGN